MACEKCKDYRWIIHDLKIEIDIILKRMEEIEKENGKAKSIINRA